MRELLASRPLFWLLLALPGLWFGWQWVSGAQTYGQIVSDTGIIATQLLLVTLAVTPLRRLFRKSRVLLWAVRRRRELGLATFGYAAGHLVVYVVRKLDPGLMLAEAAEPWLLSGWLSLILLAALALTSNDASVRRLRRWWKRLHRLVYPATALVFIHWLLSAFDPTSAYLYLAAITALQAVRLPQLLTWVRELPQTMKSAGPD
jgi:methionine sulfoxide reductase heme-binding subunit